MSYIRSVSNPEALYIVATGDDILEIMWNDGKAKSVVVSQKAFDELLDIYSDNSYCDDIIKVEGITLFPSFYEESNEKIIIEFDDYYDLELVLWSVTLDNVADYRRITKFRSWKNRFKFLFNRLKY